MILSVALLLARPSAAEMVIGPETRFTAFGYGQNNPLVAASGNLVVAAWRVEGTPYANFAFSADGGSTWQEGAGFPAPPAPWESFWEPVALCASRSAVFYSAVSLVQGVDVTIAVHRGDAGDGTLEWGPATVAVPPRRTDSHGQAYQAAAIACDSSGANVYLVCTRMTRGVPYVNGAIFVAHSADGGTSWAPPETLGVANCDGASVAVLPDGRVVVAWEDFAAQRMVARTAEACAAGTTGGCDLQFAPEFAIAPANDNLGTWPPGLSTENRNAPVLGCLSQYIPNSPKLAVDRSAGPRHGTIYAVWAGGCEGEVEPGTGRTVAAVESNDFWSTATPIEIGDDVTGDAMSSDVAIDWGETFSFHGEQGETVVIDGTVTGTIPGGGQCYGFGLYGGTDTSTIYLIGGPAQVERGSTPLSHPPAIATLPYTGTHYLFGWASGSIFSFYYRARLRRLLLSTTSAARDQRDVLLCASHDGGMTWSAPVRVNDDPPWWDNSLASVAVDGRGTVHVAWYGRTGEDECGRRTSAYLASSTDGGATFGQSQRVSRTSSLWVSGFRNNGNVGERLGIAAEGDAVHAMWTQDASFDSDVYHVRAMPDTVVATRLSRFLAVRDAHCVRVTWEFAPGVEPDEVCVLRSDRSGVETLVRCEERHTASGSACDSSGIADLGRSIAYRLRTRMADGTVQWWGPVGVSGDAIPAAVGLMARPNPFRDLVRLTLDGAVFGERVTVDVVDATGRRVTRLYEGPTESERTLEWDGTAAGRPLQPGLYWVKARGTKHSEQLRLVKLDR